MSQFDNVTVTKAANIYFDGKVTSRSVQFADGSTVTLGIMLPGEYNFGTGKKEVMEIISGNVEILLPDETEWQNITGGQSFEVKANSRFDIRVNDITDYCCSYIDE